MVTKIMCNPSNLPIGGNMGLRTKSIKNFKIVNDPHCVYDVDVIKSISELLIADYTVEQRAHIEQIERSVNRTVTPLLSTKLKEELYEVSESVANVYSEHSALSNIHASVIIKYIGDVRVDVTIYLTDTSSIAIYTDKFSGDMLLVSEDNHQNTYLENDLTAFDNTDIQSALRSMIEWQFFKNQQVEIKEVAKKRNIADPFVWVDKDFGFHLSITSMDMGGDMNITSDIRIKLKIDYFREEWTHIKVTVTLYDTTGDLETRKVSGDVGLFGFMY